jgi:hypothetical protein
VINVSSPSLFSSRLVRKEVNFFAHVLVIGSCPSASSFSSSFDHYEPAL